MTDVLLVGRSSSHFTRIARIFAIELGVPFTFRPILDITSLDPAVYGGNPALKMPVLVDEQGPLFGTENICRELIRRSGKANVVMRGDVPDRVVANAEELTLHVLSTEVVFVMARMAGGAREAPPKLLPSMENSLARLDETIDDVVAALPRDRVLSFVEVALFCSLTHLPFRDVMDVTRWARLAAFTSRFGQRESARATEYRFDAA